uniref:Uncharacterized protein n=1 Tax=Cajanus cajan TaxID=3821 RepID=A0A151SQB8_CAJCA|nr:hypothetical protein KK1_003258 [Cajanus cajan]
MIKKATDVKTSVKRHKNCRCEGRIVGQALIFFHPVVKNDLQRKLVGGVPTLV